MDLAALRTEFDKFAAYDLAAIPDDLSSASLSDAEKDAYINRGLDVCGLSLYLYRRVAFAPTNGQGTYSFTDTTAFTDVEMLSVDRVALDGAWLRDFTRRTGVFTADQFIARFRDYSSATSGVPTAVCVMGRSLVFDKPFNSAAATAGGYVWGRHLPRQLVDGGYDEPSDVPTHLHQVIAQIAVVRAAMMTIDSEQERQRVSDYAHDAYAMLVAEFRRGFMSVHGRDPDDDELRESCAVYRRVEGKNLAGK